MTHDEIMKLMLLDGSDHRTIDAVSVALKERDELRAEHRAYQQMATSDEAEGFTEMIVEAAWINELVAERDALLSLLVTIRDNAECMPVPGGYVYTVDGIVMGKIDAALGAK